MRRAAIAVLAVAMVAVAGGMVHGGGGPRAAAAVTPTWDDVAPVFAAKCAGCHQQGGVAPFSITNVLTARAYAKPILAMTQAGAMPPWMPGRDSPPILGASRRLLPADEKFLIASWVRGGAKVGSGRRITPTAVLSPAPGATITLRPKQEYTPRAASGATDDYHCMLLDPKLAQDMYVTSAVVKPQRRTLVHHVILFEAAGDNAIEARRLDAASGGKGWTCFGGPELTETRGAAGNGPSDR